MDERVLRSFRTAGPTKRSVAIACLLALAMGCVGAPSERAQQAQFKGMELYSWKPEGEDWHFSLLVGTNREKTVDEITRPENAIAGIAELKKQLSALAKGESISWRNLAKEPIPVDMEQELKSLCNGLQIKLERV